MQKRKGIALVWLRNDLRATDQQSLYQAATKHEQVIAYYAFDPAHFTTTKWGFKKTEAHRAGFLIETVTALKNELAAHNISLIIEQESPHNGLPKWVGELGVTDLYLQKEWTTEEREEEEKVIRNLPTQINIHSHYDQFLFHPEDLPMQVEDLPEVFTAFRKKCEKYSSVRPCLPSLPTMANENRLEKTFHVPSVKELGLSPVDKHPHSAFPFAGGSKAAQERIEHYFWKTEKLSFYKQTRNGLIGIDYSAKLSAWLANGSISAREVYWEVIEYEKQIKKNQSTYWLIFELLWRDYFKYISLKHQDKLFHLGGILAREYDWKNSSRTFQSWWEGTTPEPFVNANMIELNKTGWMSNRGRQNVASYFAKNLLMDWRMGAAYFEAFLIDYDVHSNYGNWLYVAGVGNDPRDRKFNVRLQAERYDEQGKFQRLWNQKSLFE